MDSGLRVQINHTGARELAMYPKLGVRCGLMLEPCMHTHAMQAIAQA